MIIEIGNKLLGEYFLYCNNANTLKKSPNSLRESRRTVTPPINALLTIDFFHKQLFKI